MFVTGGTEREGGTVLPANHAAGLLARPLDLLPEIMVGFWQGLEQHTAKLEVTTADGFKEAAELLNNITKSHASLNGKRLELAREYDKQRDANINEPAKPWLQKLEACKAKVNQLMAAFKAAEQAEIRRQQQEAEALRQKAEALRLEALAREEAAAKAVEKATTDKAFTKAAAAFDDGQAAQAMAEQAATLAAAVVIPEAVKAKGVRERQVVEFLEVTDLSLLPGIYHCADEKKIRAHILDGSLKQGTPGLNFRLATVFGGTGK